MSVRLGGVVSQRPCVAVSLWLLGTSGVSQLAPVPVDSPSAPKESFSLGR